MDDTSRPAGAGPESGADAAPATDPSPGTTAEHAEDDLAGVAPPPEAAPEGASAGPETPDGAVEGGAREGEHAPPAPRPDPGKRTPAVMDPASWGADRAHELSRRGERDVLRPGGGPEVRPPARVIAFANQKGGVGKTTTVISLGAALVELGSRVLLVDMDPQGSLGVGLGIEPHDRPVSVYNLLLEDGTAVDEVIVHSSVDGMHVLPANIDLAGAELRLVQEMGREHTLRRVLERLRYRYDFILIDCPPSLGLLTVNGLAAADGVIVPLECEYFALRGMKLLMESIAKIRESKINAGLQLEGIVATMFDGRTIHAREVIDRVREVFGDAVFKTTINKTIRFAEAPVAGEPILTYDPQSKGAEAYRDLAKEVLSRESSS